MGVYYRNVLKHCGHKAVGLNLDTLPLSTRKIRARASTPRARARSRAHTHTSMKMLLHSFAYVDGAEKIH